MAIVLGFLFGFGLTHGLLLVAHRAYPDQRHGVKMERGLGDIAIYWLFPLVCVIPPLGGPDVWPVAVPFALAVLGITVVWWFDTDDEAAS